MKKALLSLLTIAAVAALAFGASQAFFSDTETSTGNLLQAGAIDLQIDNTSYKTNIEGDLVASPETSWTIRDLTVEKFFNFLDLKPGDRGEDTISLHVNNNDAWACANIKITENSDNGITEPEDEVGGPTGEDGTVDGDLAEELNFAFWADDGDNVFETDEKVVVTGPASDVLNGASLALADSQNSFFGPADSPLLGSKDYFIGKYFCYGSLTQTPVAEGDGGPLSGATSPRGTGFSCDGSAVTNLSQTDKLVADITFYAEQARNNEGFTCEGHFNPPTPRPVIDGVIGETEWTGCTSIDFAGQKGTVCIIAYPDYLYALYQINDPTDDRSNENSVGNDQLGLNINPDPAQPLLWGKPYDIVLQTGTDPAAFTTPNPDEAGSSGLTDGWESEWVIGNDQQALPGDVQTATPYYGATDLRISEWRLPLASIVGLASGNFLKVGGGVDIGDGNSYAFPSTLTWTNPDAEFVSIIVQ